MDQEELEEIFDDGADIPSERDRAILKFFEAQQEKYKPLFEWQKGFFQALFRRVAAAMARMSFARGVRMVDTGPYLPPGGIPSQLPYRAFHPSSRRGPFEILDCSSYLSRPSQFPWQNGDGTSDLGKFLCRITNALWRSQVFLRSLKIEVRRSESLGLRNPVGPKHYHQLQPGLKELESVAFVSNGGLWTGSYQFESLAAGFFVPIFGRPTAQKA
ncbi:hypothetical protein B0T14DRAFT_249970 [Immersiella caudata]|uniref:Uncharacterized protein n=1 Tax=Immersiella caudata TaxID=314043 RepID=A0AA39WJK0_9PEZI|nr:hypothetical protein B0T14DRAFT_249970 [Immersiella caudata]